MSDINKFTSKEVLNKVLLDSSGNSVAAFSHTTQEALNAALDTTNNRLNVSLAGGTISGDVTIDGDLIVNGDNSGTYSEIITGTLDVSISGSLDNQEYTAMRLKYDDSTGAGDGSGVSLDWTWQDDATSETTIGKISTVRDSGDNYGAMKFYTAHSGSLSERMRLTSDGMLKLVQGTNFAASSNTTDNIYLNSLGASAGDGAYGASIGFSRASGGDNKKAAIVAFQDGSDADPTGLTFWTSSSTSTGADASEVMRIDSTGDVGIGTSSPNYNSTAKALTVLGGNSEDIGSVEIIGHTDSGSTAVARLYMGNRAGSQDDLVYLETKTGTGASDGVLCFYTSASGTPSEAMRLGSDKSALFSGQIHLGSSNQLRVYSEGSGGSDNQIILAKLNNLRILNQHHGGNINFSTESSSGASATNMVLNSHSKISLSNNDANTANTIFGKNAFNDGGSDVGADYNVAIGELAMGTGTLGASVNNVAIGYRALTDITGSGGGGDDNVAVGYDSATSITTGRKNVAIGMNSLKGSTDADQCVVIGALACENADVDTDGVVAIGFSALNDLTDGAQNTAVGYKAMSELTSSASNVAVGYEALKLLATGSGSNIAIGFGALDEILTGCCNIAIGTNALGNCDGAENENIAIGNNAGLNLDNGHNNTIVGANANASSGTANGQIVIGKDVTGSAGNSSATLGLSTNKVSIDLDGSDTSWAASSDERLKENIQTSTAGLSFINELRPVTFNWKKAKDVDKSMSQYQDSEEPALGAEGSYGKTMHGFIAQEVKSAIDKHSELKEGFGMWQEWEDGTQAVSDGALVPMLVKAVQELSARVEELESK